MSTDKKKHDFHLVDPSPWPIYVSFATLVLAVGAVYYFHSKALWLLLVGFALVIYGAFMWWRDVIEEAEHQGPSYRNSTNWSSIRDDTFYCFRSNVFCCLVLGLF